jgi:hypothetical protein
MDAKSTLKLVVILGLVLLVGCGGPQDEGASSSLTPTLTLTPPPDVPLLTATSAASGTGAGAGPTSTLLPTQTEFPSPTPSATASPCAGRSGSLEVRVLVGPASAVGLETHAVGAIPFTVSSEGPPYTVDAADHISFHDVLSDDEIHYDVSFEADVTFDGVCEIGPGGAELVLGLAMAWDQVVEVTAEDFHEVYPASGENAADLTLPLIDGATASVGGGEGMEVVLRLGR